MRISNRPRPVLSGAASLWVLSACAGAAGPVPAKPLLAPYVAPTEPPDHEAQEPGPPVLITNAIVLTAAGATYNPGHVLMQGGRIAAVGPGNVSVPEDTRVIDAGGAYVTPGLIDTHSHMGVYPLPETRGNDDGNEATDATTPEIWAEHAFWPQDPALWRALAGGVTTVQVLPGSTNLMAGRSFTARLRPGLSARQMRFAGAPQGFKMACGENPKAAYGERGGPKTRMANVAIVRAKFQEALAYKRRLAAYDRDLRTWMTQHDEADDPPDPPERDFALETLLKVLDGTVLLHVHCYRADEMAIMLDLAGEFGFAVRSFHHALEAYKLRDRLARATTAVSTWADWWGFKMEAYDGIPQNIALLARSGVRAIVHSDSSVEVRTLNQEAAKARTAGHKIGLEFTDDEALRWVTANPAWALGVDGQVGSLEQGKLADVVVWDRNPFSVYARTRYVFIDGALVFDRASPPRLSDFELGQPVTEVQP